MKSKKKAAAVPPVETKPTPTSPHAHPEELALSRLRVWRDNPRKTVGDVSELAASIAKVGVIEPLLVRELPEPEGEVTHEVVAGQRRFMAAILAGLATVPTMVRALADDDALELALAENAARTDVHPLEECEALSQLIETHKRRPEQVADRLGRPVRWVERRLSLRLLAPAWREDLISGRLPLAHAEMLARLDLDTQRDLHGKCERFTELPSARAFARELRFHLRNLATPPFDVTDASLPGGACKACPKRSDAQPDLFDAGGPDADAHCLDTGCWSKKCDVTWERAKKAAARAKLTVIENPAEVFTWGASLKWDCPYVGAASLGEHASEMKPVAVARDDRGGIHQLYDRAAAEALKKAAAKAAQATGGGVTDEEDEEDDEAWEARREAETKARHEAAAAATKGDLAKLRALPLPRLARASLLASDAYELFDVVRVLGRPEYKAKGDELDAWVKELPDDEVAEIALAALVLPRFQMLVAGDDEATPAEREVYGALLTSEAVTDEVDDAPAEEPAAAATTSAPTPAPTDALDVFYLTRAAWDRLGDLGRDQLRRPTDSPDPAQHVAWRELSRFVLSAPLSCHDDRWLALSRVMERFGLVLVGAELPSCRSCGISGRIEMSGNAWADETKTVCVDCASKPPPSTVDEAEAASPPTKGKGSKASKKAKVEAPAAAASTPAPKLHRDEGHGFDVQVTTRSANCACLILEDSNGTRLTKRAKKITDEAWRTEVAETLAGACIMRVARLYSQRGVCLWDSRDSEFGGKPVRRVHGLAVCDRIVLDDVEVELLHVSEEGFIWRTTETDPRQRDEGEVEWADVELIEGNRWRARKVES